MTSKTKKQPALVQYAAPHTPGLDVKLLSNDRTLVLKQDDDMVTVDVYDLVAHLQHLGFMVRVTPPSKNARDMSKLVDTTSASGTPTRTLHPDVLAAFVQRFANRHE